MSQLYVFGLAAHTGTHQLSVNTPTFVLESLGKIEILWASWCDVVCKLKMGQYVPKVVETAFANIEQLEVLGNLHLGIVEIPSTKSKPSTSEVSHTPLT
jgi:hypothetical protein